MSYYNTIYVYMLDITSLVPLIVWVVSSLWKQQKLG